MIDERLLLGLTSWLQDSDITPPDARMSASRVMTGVEGTRQLGRRWPPARFASRVRPAPRLGDFGPSGPPRAQASRQDAASTAESSPPFPEPVSSPFGAPLPQALTRIRSRLTARRVLVAMVVMASIGAIMLLLPNMLPGPGAPAVVLAPSPSAAASPTAPPSPVPTATTSPTPRPTPAPTPWPSWAPTDRAIDWHAGGVRMEANGLRLRVNGKVFRATGEALATGITYADRARLESRWREQGVEQRLVIELELDDTDWWVREMWAHDGADGPGRVYFADLADRTRTPIGESLEADVQFLSTGAERKALRKAGSAKLRLDGLRLTAFGPGARPAPLTGCDYIDASGAAQDGLSVAPLQGPGEPLENVTAMSPVEVEAVLKELDLCYRFDYQWRPPGSLADPQQKPGQELRCSAPPDGRVQYLDIGPDRPSASEGSIVYVVVADDEVRDGRTPPPAGTDCPSQ